MNFPTPGNYPKDVDGNVPPRFGGTLAIKTGTVTFENTTAVKLFTLPAGAVIKAWQTNVKEAFNGTGTDLLDIGTSGTANAYANDLALNTVGQIVTGYVPAMIDADPLTVDTDVYATYVDAEGDATEGEATITVFYVLL